ncbi:hypothetical protein V9T40_004029 [Parthenolecanium corni]|uniref:Major facilitator superfamily (MFS) profile domain-containing protein n=1 Tax=Parthenolecanium corni TaxID=536013 RepID=A0AAN9TGB1_9HEMI
MAPILQRYKNSNSDFSLDTEACSLIASIHYVGRGVGCVLVALFVDRLGRNKIITFNAISGCIVWLAVLFTKSVSLHYAIRLLFGIGIAFSETAAPLYIGENSSPNIRGVFGSMCSLAFYMGELIAFLVGTYCSYETIAIVFAAISFAVLLSTTLLREPAQHLLAKGHHKEAEERFFELRGHSDTAQQEFEQTKIGLDQPKEPFSIGLLTDKSMRAVCMVSSYMYITGYAPINAMSSLAFSSVENFTPNELTTLLGIIQLVSIFFSSSVVDRIGRRPLLMISAVICTLIHLTIAALYYCQETGISVPYFAWILFAFITAYSVLAATIMFPLMTTVRGELLSPRFKSVGACIAIIVNSIISVLWAGSFLPIAELYGMKANFLWFAAMSFVFLVYVYFDLPETKGLTLTEIQSSLKKEIQNT